MSQDYTEEERELLRQAKAMREIIDTKAWQIYAVIIESQIKTRESIIMDSAPGVVEPLALEHIKGARLGLRLALDTVKQIIADVADLTAQESDSDEGEAR